MTKHHKWTILLPCNESKQSQPPKRRAMCEMHVSNLSLSSTQNTSSIITYTSSIPGRSMSVFFLPNNFLQYLKSNIVRHHVKKNTAICLANGSTLKQQAVAQNGRNIEPSMGCRSESYHRIYLPHWVRGTKTAPLQLLCVFPCHSCNMIKHIGQETYSKHVK